MEPIRTLLCCIGRKENQYIREYVEYYKGIGFTNICLYDNNFDGDEDFRDAIGDYIDDGYVFLKDYRNKSLCQMQSYEECYHEYKNDYDWIAFFDCDEFLTFAESGITDISKVLPDSRFDGYNMIHVNWMLFEDNGLVRNDGRPVLERFTKPMLPYDKKFRCPFVSDNAYNKSIVRGYLDDIKFKTPCTPINVSSCCDGNGNKVNEMSVLCPINYECMYLRHYSYKTIEEFIEKLDRGFPDHRHTAPRYMQELGGVFFKVNKPTAEKLEYVKDRIGLDLFRFYPEIIRKDKED